MTSRFVLLAGEALLDITDHPQLAQFLLDARKGSLDNWHVDPTTLELRYEAPSLLLVTGALPYVGLLILTIGSAGAGFLGLTMVRRRSRP